MPGCFTFLATNGSEAWKSLVINTAFPVGVSDEAVAASSAKETFRLVNSAETQI